jgi:hypothetical protein
MAVLPDNERLALWAEFMRQNTAPYGTMTKADLRAAVNALDDFLETNAAAINSTIPQPARGQMTTQQKALLLQFVVARRYLNS